MPEAHAMGLSLLYLPDCQKRSRWGINQEAV